MAHRFIQHSKPQTTQTCPLCGSDLVLEYEHDGSSLWTSSWGCARLIAYLGGIQGEYSVVLAKEISNGKEYMEESEYYYTEVSEISVDVTMKTTSVFVQSKTVVILNRVLGLDEIKRYLKRLPKMAAFI